MDKSNDYQSAGLSAKYVEKANSKLCTIEMLQWAHVIYVFEDQHIQRIQENTGSDYLSKIVNLDIADEYSYFQKELVLALLESANFKKLSSNFRTVL